MKKILLLLTITFLFASCGSKSTGESVYVPKDAIGVMYINVKSLSEKSNGLDFKNLAINDLITDKAPDELKAYMNEFMTAENIKKTFREEFILGFGSFRRMSGVGGLILPIKDAASFEALIQPMIKEMPGIEKEENVGKNDAFTVYFMDEIAIGWNDKTALIIGAKNYAGTELKDLTSLEKSKSILATDYYSSFFDQSKDLGVHISSTPLGSTLNGLLTASAGMDVELENNNLSYYGSFEDNELTASSKLKLNNDFKNLLGYKSWMSTSYDKSLLDVMPEKPMIFAKMSIDTEALHNHIEGLQDNKVLPLEAREEFKKEFSKTNKEMQSTIGMSTEEFANIFDGSMVFAMTEGVTVQDSIRNYDAYFDDSLPKYKMIERKIPNMYGAIAIKNKAKFDKFFNAMNEMSPLPKNNKGVYEIDNDAFMVITDNNIFITNNAEKANEVKSNGKMLENLSGFEYKSNLSHSMYVYTKGNYAGLIQGLSGFNPYNYNSGMDALTEQSSKLYDKYFGESHTFMDVDGTEMTIATKGGKNSLVQYIKYMDEVAKAMNKELENEKEDTKETVTIGTGDDEETIIEVEETK